MHGINMQLIMRHSVSKSEMPGTKNKTRLTVVTLDLARHAISLEEGKIVEIFFVYLIFIIFNYLF